MPRDLDLPEIPAREDPMPAILDRLAGTAAELARSPDPCRRALAARLERRLALALSAARKDEP